MMKRGPESGELGEAQHDEFLRQFTAVQPALRRFVRAHVTSADATEDVLQKTALVIWRKFAQYDGRRSFTAWALGIARNEVLHERRSMARDRLVLDDDITQRLADRIEERSGEMDRRRVHLNHCLEKLPERARSAVSLFYSQGLSADRIAEQLRSTANAVRILLFRARLSLVQCIQETMNQNLAKGGAE
jgi:RNA polymerase sigma-70 factor (ECF subfamily)